MSEYEVKFLYFPQGKKTPKGDCVEIYPFGKPEKLDLPIPSIGDSVSLTDPVSSIDTLYIVKGVNHIYNLNGKCIISVGLFTES